MTPTYPPKELSEVQDKKLLDGDNCKKKKIDWTKPGTASEGSKSQYLKDSDEFWGCAGGLHDSGLRRRRQSESLLLA